MRTSQRSLLFSLLLSALFGADQAAAADKDGKQQAANRDRVQERTRTACRDAAKDRDFEIVDLGKVGVNGEDGRVTMRLKRKGESYSGDCRYDGSAKRANLSVEERGGGGGATTTAERERAERACRGVAKRERFEVANIGKSRKLDRDRLRLDMDLRRNSRRFDGSCTFDIKEDSANLNTEAASGAGNEDGRGTGHASADAVKDKCVAAGQAQGMVPNNFGKATNRGDGMSELLITFQQREGGQAWYRCLYDNRNKSATLELK